MITYKTDTNRLIHFTEEQTPSRYGDVVIIVETEDKKLYESDLSRKFETVDEAIEFYDSLIDEVGHRWEKI